MPSSSNPFNNSQYMKLYTSVKDGVLATDEFGQFINAENLDGVLNVETKMSPVARKVRVELGRREYLHMREVEVFAYNGTHVARGQPATHSPSNFVFESNTYPASNAVDGFTDGIFLETYSHTHNTHGKYHHILLPQKISQVSCIMSILS